MSESTVLAEIANERARQVALGFDAAHDDKHENGSLVIGAAAKILYPHDNGLAPELWPFDQDRDWFGGPARKLYIEGAAMLVAECERLDRIARGGK